MKKTHRKKILIALAIAISACTSNTPITPKPGKVIVLNHGKFNKYITEKPGSFHAEPVIANIDPSGAASAFSIILKLINNISLPEDEALALILESGEKERIIERNGNISFLDLKKALARKDIQTSGHGTRWRSDDVVISLASRMTPSYKALILVGNNNSTKILPLIGIYTPPNSPLRYFIVIESADNKYIYALDPYKGKIAITQDEFLDMVPTVLFKK